MQGAIGWRTAVRGLSSGAALLAYWVRRSSSSATEACSSSSPSGAGFHDPAEGGGEEGEDALEPRPAARTAVLDGDAVLVTEPGRRVRLSRFAGRPPLWRRAEIAAGNYGVVVEVEDADPDAALDPALFED